MRWRFLPVLVVLVAAGASSRAVWGGPVDWADPDSLFYQAQSLEVRGQSQAVAIRRVFDGPLARAAKRWDHQHQYASNPAWVAYSTRFYRRRWLTPALAAALAPVFADRSLQIVALLAYVAVGLLLYRLLRHRFSPAVSAASAAACLWLPPLRWYSFEPMADSAGLALLLAALLAALLVVERGNRWLPAWVAAMAALAVTKEDGLVALVGVAWLAARQRRARAVSLIASGVAITAPVYLLLGASLRETLAYAENNFQRVKDPSWGFVLGHYPAAVRSTLHDDLFLPRVSGWPAAQTALWYLGCALVLVGVVALLARSGRDSFFGLTQGALAGAAVFVLLSVNYSAMRLELVFVPAVAVGLALVLDLSAHAVVGRRRPSGSYG